jgi:hypothetical protein
MVELMQYVINIHPGTFPFPYQGTMAAPGITVQFLHGFYYSSTDGIEVDIPDKCQQIVFLFAENGFIAVFKEVAATTVATIEILGVPCQLPSHYRRYPLLSAFEQDVGVLCEAQDYVK